jgi:hypothetical protein
MHLHKRLLQQVVDALRIVAERTQKSAQLRFERGVEATNASRSPPDTRPSAHGSSLPVCRDFGICASHAQ